ncbi:MULTISPECIES: sn-glycerol-3-phosphate ABC transporter ATP-binding protein UgpC [unclassified Roseitalea]|uniref:ABC transporter ATP-binding protein n=1 Tax=unclassified Roseitalea TaxID=2639107 RepID=UPI00273F6A04|nr:MULTISPECIES: sn-glycerol-3-phosphate ABC transporter ATP-binding protein UgpC [unclassified Roseitalea]
MAPVGMRGLRKAYGNVEAVRDISLEIENREFVVLVGPSGCGKSTLLRMIAGLEDIDAGELTIAGKRVNEVHPADRGLAMVFQSYALYPHMSVAENLAFGLKMSGMGRDEIESKVQKAAGILQIGELLKRRPRELSGGQRQRVAIGRAIVREPEVFLFDEPLSNLDADLRAQMRVELARLHGELQSTMIYVTHDQVEAMTLAQRIVVLNGGRIEQQGAPLELYERPVNTFVAGFLGQPKMNLVQAIATTIDGQPALRLGADSGPMITIGGAAPAALRADQELVVGVRPDAVQLSATKTGHAIPAALELVERLGSDAIAHVRIEGVDPMITVETREPVPTERGTPVWLEIDAADLHVFRSDGERL